MYIGLYRLIPVPSVTTQNYLILLTYSVQSQAYTRSTWSLPSSSNDSLTMYTSDDLDLGTCHVEDTQDAVCVWIMDPMSCSEDEKNFTAQSPSKVSILLTEQFNELGQNPSIEAFNGIRRVDIQHEVLGYNPDKNCWMFTVLPPVDKELQILVHGTHLALYNCFVRDTFVSFAKSTVTDSFASETDTKVAVHSAGIVQMIKHACYCGAAVLDTGEDLLWTRDGFIHTTSILVSSHLLPDGMSTVSASSIAVTFHYVILLVDNALYTIDVETTTSQLLQADTTVTAIQGRLWCPDQDDRESTDDLFAAWSDDTLYIYNTSDIASSVLINSTVPAETGQQTQIHAVAFSTFYHRVAVVVNVTESSETKIRVYYYHEQTDEWQWIHDFPDNHTGFTYNIQFIWSGFSKFVLWSGPVLYFYTSKGFTYDIKLSSINVAPYNIQHVVSDKQGDVILVSTTGEVFYTTAHEDSLLQFTMLASRSGPAVPWFDPAGTLYMLTVEDGAVVKNKYPLKNEAIDASYPDITCPFQTLMTSDIRHLYTMDIGETISVWAALVYPKHNYPDQIDKLKLYVDGESLLVQFDVLREYQLYERYVVENMTVTFMNSQNLSIDSWRDLKDQVGFDIVPAEVPAVCHLPAHTMSFISVGCKSDFFIKIDHVTDQACDEYMDYNYTIPASTSQEDNLVVQYDYNRYGCPLVANVDDEFLPPLLICHGEVCELITANLVIWEAYSRPFQYNATMAQVGCTVRAQTWQKMMSQTNITETGSVWGPENYVSCFVDTNTSTPGSQLKDSYEIFNMTGQSHLKFRETQTGIYLFHVKVVDPLYSFCTLETSFTVDMQYHKEEQNFLVLGTTVFTFLVVVMIVLVFSFFHFRDKVYFLIDQTQLRQVDDS